MALSPSSPNYTNYNSDLLVHREYRGALGIKDPGPIEPLVPVLPYNYKFNVRELQDEMGLNMTAMDFRQYDNALGRFNSLDVLSELAPGISPYRFAFNNPVSWADPTGLFETKKAAMAHIEAYGLTGATVSYNNTRGYWEIDNNGYTFGYDNGSFQPAYVTEEGVVFESWGVAPGNNSNSNDTLQSYVWELNTTIGAASTVAAYYSGFLQYNELWHKTKGNGYSFAWKNKWKNPGAKAWRNKQVKKFAGPRKFGTTLQKAGGIALGADIVLSGELKPSHVVNGAMLAISGTGVGSIIAAVWFIADYGTMGVNYLSGNGAKGLGDMLDEQMGTYEMYDGLY